MAQAAKDLEKKRKKMSDEQRRAEERLDAADAKSKAANDARIALLKEALKEKQRQEREAERMKKGPFGK
jgi:hypothetical protein